MRVLVDTCVIIDALQSRVPFAEDAQRIFIYSKLFTLFHLLDTTSLDCRKAISSEITDYEDAVMVETAIRSEMDCIVTRNVKDYMKSSVKVYEPSAFLKLLEAENEIG